MIEKILNKIENSPITLSQWLLGFLGIFMIRFFFEAFSSPSSSGVLPSDPQTFIHYLLFFLTVTLSTICLVGFFTKNYYGAAKVALFSLPVIWLAPIVDIILSTGKGFKMSYLFGTHEKLIINFFTFFGENLTRGATYGIRLEIILILIGVGGYVWLRQRNVGKTLGVIVLTYFSGFVLASLPGIIYTFSHKTAVPVNEVILFFENIINRSNLLHNTLYEGNTSVSPLRFLELGFNKLLSQVLFIMSLILGGVILWRSDKFKFLSVIKNIRLERNNFYISALLCGMGFAYLNRLGTFHPVDLLGILCLIIAWMALWMQAVHFNDVMDLEIDKISNPNRPLVKRELSKEEMLETGKLWLVIGLLGAWVAGFYPFFMSLIYVATSYIYSVPPLRLRRFPLLPSFLIAIVCLATILAGFFFVSTQKELLAFPILISVGILVIVTLAINFKDLKDIEGDKANQIMTLATLFPTQGRKIIAFLLALSILLTPFFLSFYLLYIFALPFAFLSYHYTLKEPYQEKNIFRIRFLFLLCVGLSYLALYYFVPVL